MRDVEAGEELFYDYGVENLEDDDFVCLCRQSNCRGVITKDDWKLESVQKLHGDHMAPHVLKLVKEFSAMREFHDIDSLSSPSRSSSSSDSDSPMDSPLSSDGSPDFRERESSTKLPPISPLPMSLVI